MKESRSNSFAGTAAALLIAMRPLHWVKGIFIYFPLLFGQRLFDAGAFCRTTTMFAIFCLASSAMYLINDVIDVDEDRSHPLKRMRPIAAGRIGAPLALAAAAAILAAAVPLSLRMGTSAGMVVGAYVILNYVYARHLKHMVIVDVFCLSGFFYLRLIAGGIAGGVTLSNWILICTVLLALFLGLNKRRYDIDYSKETRPVLQKYDKYFLDRMISVVSSSLVMAYSLYVIDPSTIARVGSNSLLYTIPFVYYGIFRYMYVLDTKWFGGDPVRILVADYKLQISIALWLAVCISVIYFKR